MLSCVNMASAMAKTLMANIHLDSLSPGSTGSDNSRTVLLAVVFYRLN